MTDLQSFVAPTCDRLADLLAAAAVDIWDAPSLCEKWLVRHVIAHMTMPARLTPEQFVAEMAAAGETSPCSDTVATLDASLPRVDLLDQLTAANGTWFGADQADVLLEATDTGWVWGTGQLVHADSGSLVALLSGRALPDGRSLPRR